MRTGPGPRGLVRVGPLWLGKFVGRQDYAIGGRVVRVAFEVDPQGYEHPEAHDDDRCDAENHPEEQRPRYSHRCWLRHDGPLYRTECAQIDCLVHDRNENPAYTAGPE